MKILSVDDSKMVHMVVAKALKPYDLQHFTAFNGLEALAVAEKELPDLILMDITMPEMNGLEALAKLKANPATASIPVVMLTAEGGTDSMDKAFESGVSKYITKPFTEDVLLTTLLTVVPLQKKPE